MTKREKKRAIYAFEFEDGSVYVGLTKNYKKRYSYHVRKGIVAERSKLADFTFIEFGDWLSPERASIEEILAEEHYRALGWNVLNKAPTGGLGGRGFAIWSFDRARSAARKCSSRSEFQRRFPGAYSASRKNGWLDHITRHLKELIKPNGYWLRKSACIKEAQRYETKSEFARRSAGAYRAAKQMGWLSEIDRQFKKVKRANGHWSDKSSCANEAKKYKTRNSFAVGSMGAYSVAWKNGWLDEVCAHMPKRAKPNSKN